MNMRKLLLNVIKLSAFPENCAECVCEHCHSPYTDTVEHYIMQCQGLVSERSSMWDNILDQVTCSNEAKIMNLDIKDVLLVRRLNKLLNELEYEQCIVCVAKNINALMYVI